MARTKQTARKSTGGRKPRKTLADQAKQLNGRTSESEEPLSEDAILEKYLSVSCNTTTKGLHNDCDGLEGEAHTSTTMDHEDASEEDSVSDWRTTKMKKKVSIGGFLEAMDHEVYEQEMPWIRYPPTSASMSVPYSNDEYEDVYWEQDARIKEITRRVMEDIECSALPKLMQLLDAEEVAKAIGTGIARQIQQYGRGMQPDWADLAQYLRYIYRMRQMVQPRALDFALAAMERYSMLCCFHATRWLADPCDFEYDECGASDDLYSMLIETKAGWDSQWNVSDTLHALLAKRQKLESIGADKNYFTKTLQVASALESLRPQHPVILAQTRRVAERVKWFTPKQVSWNRVGTRSTSQEL